MTKKQILTRWSLVVCLVFLGVLSSLNLKINDNALDLLPQQAARGNIQLLQEMGLIDRVFITLSATESLLGSNTDYKTALKKSCEQLGTYMQGSGLFSFVLAKLPGGYEYALFNTFRNSLPYLLEEEDYTELVSLTSKEGLQQNLEKSFMLLNSPAGIALKTQVQLDPLAMVPRAMDKLNLLRSEFTMLIDDGAFLSSDGKSCLIIAESKTSLTDSAEASKILKLLEGGYQKTLVKGVEPRIIGSLPHTLANTRMIQKDLRLLLPLATVLLLLFLGLSLRDIRALVVLAVPFLAAPVAITITSFIHGEISGLALGFGIVLLGIGVDFSIHLFWTLTREKGSSSQLLQRLKRPILFASLTTSTVFVVLLFSSVVSHQQMATLALSGVLLAVIFSWLLIPTLISDSGSTSAGSKSISSVKTDRRAKKFSGLIIIAWMGVLTFGITTWPKLHYNGDLRVLDVPDEQVRIDEKHFSSTWGDKGEQAFVFVEGKTLFEILNRNSDVYGVLNKNKDVKFQSFAPILPGPATQEKNYQHWLHFWQERRAQFDKDFFEIATTLGFAQNGFAPFFSWLDSNPEQMNPDLFLGGPLEPLFNTMLSEPQEGGNNENSYLAITTVKLDQSSKEILSQLESEFAGTTVLSNSKWRADVEKYMQRDISLLSGAAGVAIILLVFFQFRQLRATIAVLAPVLTALSAMSIFCYMTGRDLNTMHLIMSIMVIGLSVDYGIFIVCSRQLGAGRSAPVAVSICAVSSLIGFGVLACASHPALHALGTTVLVGIGVAWPTALVVSPALLAFGKE